MVFVNFNTLEQGTVYTVLEMQYLKGSSGYFYQIGIKKPDNSFFDTNIEAGSNLYDKLETIRTGAEKNRFSFKISTFLISPDVSAQLIIIRGENDAIILN